MKKYLSKITISLLLVPTSVLALIAGPSKIVGTIGSFDKKKVVVENAENKYEIPRDYISDKEIKPNNKVEILLSQEQIEKIKIQKKKPAKK